MLPKAYRWQLSVPAGWTGVAVKQRRECGPHLEKLYTQPTEEHSLNQSVATGATQNCVVGYEETLTLEAIQTTVT